MPVVPQRKEPKSITKPKLLLGEGNDEVEFFSALLRHLDITEIQVEEYGGKDRLGGYLKTVQAIPGFSGIVSIGIIRDADDNASNALKSVCGFLSRASLTPPDAHGAFAGERPKCGIFLMPDGINSGMLEDLCLESLRNDLAFPCIEEFLNCAAKNSGRAIESPAKAKIHAWLSSLSKPDLRLGQAAQRRQLSWDDPAFGPLKDFIKAL